jgi:hypothetical protein
LQGCPALAKAHVTGVNFSKGRVYGVYNKRQSGVQAAVAR